MPECSKNNTLFVPLVARINISKKFPEYFYDEKALELEQYLPQGADKESSEYSNMAAVARYYNMDKTVTEFVKRCAESNIIYLGVGLETAYDRLNKNLRDRVIHWYAADLPEVIEARKKVLRVQLCILESMIVKNLLTNVVWNF